MQNKFTDYKLRALSADDFAMLLDYDWHPLIKERDTIYLLIAAMHGEVSFVVMDDAKPVAILLALMSADRKSAFVLKLHVAPQVRDIGIASNLMKIFEEKVHALGAKMVFLFASGAKKSFYSGRGYVAESPNLPRYVHRYLKAEKSCEVLYKELNLTSLKTRKDVSFREKIVDFGGVDT